MADGLDAVLDNMNQLVAATKGTQSKLADALGFPLQQITDYQHAQLMQTLALFADRMGVAVPNEKFMPPAFQASDTVNFAIGNSKLIIEKLVQLHELSAKHARSVVKTAEGLDDFDTVKLMGECIEFHVKSAWMLRALLQ